MKNNCENISETWYNRKNNCMEVYYAKRKKKTECAYFRGAACNSKRRIQEVESDLKQLRSQRKEIQEKIEEREKETLFRAVVVSGRTVEDVLAILKSQDQKEEQ